MLLRELAFSFEPGAVSDIVGEGMLVIGWVAMWRPLEIFLYEWVPPRRPLPHPCQAREKCRSLSRQDEDRARRHKLAAWMATCEAIRAVNNVNATRTIRRL